jgi:hypothetical protein
MIHAPLWLAVPPAATRCGRSDPPPARTADGWHDRLARSGPSIEKKFNELSHYVVLTV